MFVLSKTDGTFGGKRYRTMTGKENSLPPFLTMNSRGRPRWKTPQTTRRPDGGERGGDGDGRKTNT